MRFALVPLVLAVGCAHATSDDGSYSRDADTGNEDPGPVDTARDDTKRGDTLTTDDTAVGDTSIATDTGSGTKDTGTKDTGTVVVDTGTVVTDTSTGGVIKGGPCSSGASGATAFRIRWAGSGSGSTAYPVYEVTGLPDSSGFKVGAYGYSIGYTPTFEDIYLGVGGLRLDSSNFVDVDLSTAGIGSISRATLSIFGRSFNTTSSGSYNWQTFDGTGATPTGAISNSAPYQWYGPLGYLGSGPIGDVTAVIKTGKSIKLRIKAGGPSGSLIVNRIELCLEAT
jgi:hypothetical protein